MIAYITDNKYIHLDQVTQGSEESLVKHFSVRHPRSYFIDTSAEWDGWYRKYSVSKQRLSLPFLDELRICCQRSGIPLEIDDKRSAPKYPAPQIEQITDKLIDDITLDDHQVRALKIACAKEIGLFDMKTGGGKTEVICGLVKMFRCPTLVITEQTIVLDQIVDRLRLRNVVHNDDIGKFCHGERPDGELVMVGSIQSLNSPSRPRKTPKRCTTKQARREGKRLAKRGLDSDKDSFLSEELTRLPASFPIELVKTLKSKPSGIDKLQGRYLDALVGHVSLLFWERAKHWYEVRKANAKHLQDLAKKCDLLLVDECDKATSKLYSTLFNFFFLGRRKYGFSGTPFDPARPVEALVLKERLGSVIATAGRRELEQVGRIIPIKYFSFGFGENGNKKDSRTFDIAEQEIMIGNSEFHEMVAKIVNSFPGDSTMIIVDTSAIEELGLILEEIIPNSKFLYNKTTKAARRKYIKMFEDKELSCLISGKILKRGFDIKGGIGNLILCGGGALVSNIDQMIGRSVRLNEKGFARVFDFFFLNNKYLYAHSRARLKAVLEMGYECKVIIGGQEIDGKRLIKSRFRIPKTV